MSADLRDREEKGILSGTTGTLAMLFVEQRFQKDLRTAVEPKARSSQTGNSKSHTLRVMTR